MSCLYCLADGTVYDLNNVCCTVRLMRTIPAERRAGPLDILRKWHGLDVDEVQRQLKEKP